MITAKTLKKMLEKVPDEATCFGYEGEDIGLVINMPDGSQQFIRAREEKVEDVQPKFTL